MGSTIFPMNLELTVGIRICRNCEKHPTFFQNHGELDSDTQIVIKDIPRLYNSEYNIDHPITNQNNLNHEL